MQNELWVLVITSWSMNAKYDSGGLFLLTFHVFLDDEEFCNAYFKKSYHNNL